MVYVTGFAEKEHQGKVEKLMARIDYSELKNYAEVGELSAIPVICDGSENARHSPYHLNAEPDADSVYCRKCGKVVFFQPLKL